MQKVVLVGAANIDILGFPFNKLIQRDSNPGRVRLCPGGVSRNIAENLSRMGISAELITAVGGGVNGEYILNSCRDSGIGTDHVLILPDRESSTYLAIMDEEGDMALALSDMSISDEISIDYIKSRRKVFEDACVIEIDPCLSAGVIEYIVDEFSDVPVFIDPVSMGKAHKLKNILGGIHTLKLNKLEAEFLSGRSVDGPDDLAEVSRWFLSEGVDRVFITLGSRGVFYNDGEKSGEFRPPEIQAANATGAGDAFMAGLIYGFIRKLSVESTVEYATGASVAALMSEDTVNPDISEEFIKGIIKESFK